MSTTPSTPAGNARASSAPAPSPAPRFRESVTLVAGREVTQKLRSKAFVVSTIILMLVVMNGHPHLPQHHVSTGLH